MILVVHASYAGALVAPWLSLHSDLPRFEYTGPIEEDPRGREALAQLALCEAKRRSAGLIGDYCLCLSEYLTREPRHIPPTASGLRPCAEHDLYGVAHWLDPTVLVRGG